MPNPRGKRGKPKKRRREEAERAAREARPPAAERLLIDGVAELGSEPAAERVLCTSLGRGQFAAEYVRTHPEAAVTCHFLDVYHADRAQESAGNRTPAPRIVCAADPPGDEVELVALPFRKGNEAELVRDLIQSGYDALVDGGRMLVAFDSTDDAWLHDELRRIFDKVTRQPGQGGVVYGATKRGPLKKRKDFGCEFAFRDRERLVRAFSRPGVFSHRRVDAGTRALLQAVEVEPTDRIVDLGCGAGTATAALALRAPEGRVLGIDSNARALECTRRTAELNGLDNVDVRLTADGSCDEPETYDLVVGNPPYFSQFEIARTFVNGALDAVRSGGLVAFVTRKPDWFAEAMAEFFDDVAVAEVKSYSVVAGTGR